MSRSSSDFVPDLEDDISVSMSEDELEEQRNLGADDGDDAEPFNPNACRDLDADTCDDCSVGTDDFGPLPDNDIANDGLDTDGDLYCDEGADLDDDNDGADCVSSASARPPRP